MLQYETEKEKEAINMREIDSETIRKRRELN
jgi:hypothetical protein